MKITFFANPGAQGQFDPFAEQLRTLDHGASVISLDRTNGQPRDQYDYRDICAFSDWREPDCAQANLDQARRTAAQVEACLSQERPDVAVVWGNATCGQRAAVAVCRRLGVPVAIAELGWFRRAPEQTRTLLLDCVGLNDRATELSSEWWDRRLTVEQDAELDEYIGWWKRTKSSKHDQHGEPLPPRVSACRRRGVPVLLVLLQAQWDAAAFFSSGRVTPQADVMRMVRKAAADEWLVLVKEHPGAMRRALPQDGELWVRDVNLHDCLEAADCVVTANSNAGLEALLYEKPVICLADAPYGQLGFTFDVRDADGLERMLGRVQSIMAPHLGNRFLRAFLHYVIFEYCFAPHEVERLVGKLQDRLAAGDCCAARDREPMEIAVGP